MYKIWCWSFLMLSSTLVQIWIKYYINCFMYYLLPTTQKVEKITEFISESIPKFISIIWENIGWIWGLPFMNLNKLDVKNKNTNLYCIFYILFIRNQRKNWLPNKYRFRPFSSLGLSLGFRGSKARPTTGFRRTTSGLQGSEPNTDQGFEGWPLERAPKPSRAQSQGWL